MRINLKTSAPWATLLTWGKLKSPNMQLADKAVTNIGWGIKKSVVKWCCHLKNKIIFFLSCLIISFQIFDIMTQLSMKHILLNNGHQTRHCNDNYYNLPSLVSLPHILTDWLFWYLLLPVFSPFRLVWNASLTVKKKKHLTSKSKTIIL